MSPGAREEPAVFEAEGELSYAVACHYWTGLSVMVGGKPDPPLKFFTRLATIRIGSLVGSALE